MVEMLATDDGFKVVVDRAGVCRQSWRQYVTANVLTFTAEAVEQMWGSPLPVPEKLEPSPDQLLAGGRFLSLCDLTAL